MLTCVRQLQQFLWRIDVSDNLFPFISSRLAEP